MNSIRTVAVAALLGVWPALATAGDAAAQPAQPQAGAPVTNPLAIQSLDGLSATRERPLFSARRRPPAPIRVAVAPPPPPAPPPQPPQVAVYGIVAEPAGSRAMIRANGDKIVGVRVGDDVAGWKVSKIERRVIELSLADRAVSFAMFAANSPAAGPDVEVEEDDPDNVDAPPRKRRRSRE
jgi:general secretion pathway protein N